MYPVCGAPCDKSCACVAASVRVLTVAAMSSADEHDAMLVADLQAEHAQLEVTRKAYSEESQAVIKEQKHLISSLTEENEVC